MANSPYATPILITPDDKTLSFQRVSKGQTNDGGMFSEAWLQALLYRSPGILPVEEIDPAHAGCIPVCREMNTLAGPVDLLYVTPQGRLVLAETKLWRNPEARRTVITQVLDYAKELATWEYEDLRREVARATKREGDVLLDLVRAAYPDTDEARFIDNVSKTLQGGRFLLLIVGDGIREGVQALTSFLDRFGSLEFTFGLIEVGVFDNPSIGRFIQPMVLAKTMIFKRTIVLITKDGHQYEEEEPKESVDEVVDPAWAARYAFYKDFWARFVPVLKLDDMRQAPPKATKSENIYLSMPPSGSQAWVSAYFAQSKKQVGVYLRLANSALGKVTYEKLSAEREQIDRELQTPVEWYSKDGKFSIATRMDYDDLENESTRVEISAFFADRINRFVNVFRPRLERVAEELGTAS